LKFNGTPVGTDTEIKVNEIEKLAYIPDQDYFGLDVFDWNASDGKDFAIVPKRVSVFITSVNDPPEIVDFEEDGLVFEYGDESITVTNTAAVRDADGDRLTKALVSISQNFVMGEDSLYYDRIEDLNFDWQDSIGVLTISGISTVDIYQEAIRSLKYVNLKRLSPTGNGREIEIVLYDLDTISIPYARQISFEDNFVELEIPNAFTPNGDDTNESWGIKNIDIYGSYEISVYSRSGLRVFESTLREKEWDGKYEGNLVPAGNYYYVISIDKFKKTYTGTVLVLR
jgi:gliding motility-associated-like protein